MIIVELCICIDVCGEVYNCIIFVGITNFLRIRVNFTWTHICVKCNLRLLSCGC